MDGQMTTRRKLTGIVSGRIKAPPRILLYAPEGIGKTTFANHAPNPVFLCRESGTERFDKMDRLPEAPFWRDSPRREDGTATDVLSQLEDLRVSDHDFQTIAVDTLDWLEPLVHRYVCDSDPKSKGSIVLAHGGFGKGYDVAINEWRAFLFGLDLLRKERGMTVILLAHSHVKKFENPEGENFDRYQMKMSDKAAALMREWCDAVLFANTKTFAGGKITGGTTDDKKPKEFYAYGTQTRYIYTDRRPAFDAKNRFGLPEEMPLSWDDLAKAMNDSDMRAERLRAGIDDLLSGLTEKDRSDAIGALDRAKGDPDKLDTLLNWVKARLSK